MNDHAPRQPAYARSGGSEPVHLTPSNRFRSRPDESELVAGLWQESCFSRLPNDAPQELREYIHDIDNPRRVYAVHRASRRHGFQLLVERYALLFINCSAEKLFPIPWRTLRSLKKKIDTYISCATDVAVSNVPRQHALPVASASQASLRYEDIIRQARGH